MCWRRLKFLRSYHPPSARTATFSRSVCTNSDLEKVLDELAAIAPGGRRQVLEMYNYATSKPFGFLFCELSKGARAPTEVFHANFTPLTLKNGDP